MPQIIFALHTLTALLTSRNFLISLA